MASELISLTIALNDPDLDAEEQDAVVQNLLNQLQDLDEVARASRVTDPNPPENTKAVGGFLMGLLTAQVNQENLKKVLGFVGDRLKLKVKAADGRELEVEASSKEELEFACAKAQEFLKAS